jgi:hypothetical protein
MHSDEQPNEGFAPPRIIALLSGALLTGLGGYIAWPSVAEAGVRGALTDPLFWIGSGFASLSLAISVTFYRIAGPRTKRRASVHGTMDRSPGSDSGAAQGHTEDTRVNRFLLAFTIVWNLAAWPLAYATLTGAITVHGTPWLVVVFPVLGVAIAVATFWPTIKVVRHGATRLTFEPTPGRVGQPLNAVLHTQLDASSQPSAVFNVHLACYRRYVFYTRSAGDRTKSYGHDMKWMKEKTVRARVGVEGTLEIPVSFALPPHLPASTSPDDEDRIVWNLSAVAAMPGVDYSVQFEIPVGEADPFAGQDVVPGAHDDAEIDAEIEEPVSSGVEMRRTDTGGVEFSFAIGRRLLPMMAAGLFGLILVAGGLYGLFSGYFFQSLILLGPGGLLLHIARFIGTERRTITAENGAIVVTTTINNVNTDRTYAPSDLSDLFVFSYPESGGFTATTNDGMSGDYRCGLEAFKIKPGKPLDHLEPLDSQVERRAYLDEHFERIILGRGIRTQQEAEWIADQIRAATEPQPAVS